MKTNNFTESTEKNECPETNLTETASQSGGITLETEDTLTLAGYGAAGDSTATPFTLPPDWDGGDYYVTGIDLSAYDISLDVGNTLTLSASVCPPDVPNPTLAWHSTEEDIATVIDGVIYAHSVGSTLVYAVSTDGGACQSAYCNVCVLPRKPVTGITVSAAKTTLEIDESVSLTATITPANASNPTILWRSENAAVASVDATGRATANSAGTAEIRAYAQDGSGVYGARTITVNPLPVSSISLNHASLELRKGRSSTLTATVYPAKATNKAVKWYSCNESIATIDENTGVVTAVGNTGERVTVYAVSQDGTDIHGFCEITVLAPIAVEFITLSETTKIVSKLGETFTLEAFVSPEAAYYESITWQSSDSSVASVDTNGVVTAKKDGVAVITAIAGGVISDGCQVNVERDRVEIYPDEDDPTNSHNIVCFKSSGKIWRCIDRELVFSQGAPSPCRSREDLNCRIANADMQTLSVNEYTDEELLLLYAIDPYGVAYYIYWYAEYGQSGDRSLADKLDYKDRMFELFFKRRPKYYARTFPDGEYYVTNDKSDLNDVISESELYFGLHPLWDLTTWAAIAQAAFDIALLCVGAVGRIWKTVEVIQKIAKVGTFLGNTKGVITDGIVSTWFNHELDEKLENTSLNWVIFLKDSLTLYNSIVSLAEVFAADNSFYGDQIKYTAENVKYKIHIAHGETFIEMEEINEAIKALQD